MKIVGIENEKVGNVIVSCYRIKIDSRTQRAYNRFKNDIRESIGFADTHGFGDRGMLRGDGFYITAMKTAKFMHIIVVANKSTKKKISKIISERFEIGKFQRKRIHAT